jgi:hypothetical protein
VLKVLLVVAIFALLTYGLIRVIERRGLARGTKRRSAPPRRPVAPDDDTDFLRDLDRLRKRRQKPDPQEPTGEATG